MPNISYTNRWPHYIKIPFQYGLYTGLIAFPFMLFLYYIGYHPFLIPFFLDYRIALLAIVIFFSLKEVRDHYKKGNLYFWQGMVGGIVLTFSFATLVSIFLYGYITLDSEFLHSYVHLSLEHIKSFSESNIERLGRTVYEEGIHLIQHADTKFMITRFFAQSCIISLFVTTIISAILQRQLDYK